MTELPPNALYNYTWEDSGWVTVMVNSLYSHRWEYKLNKNMVCLFAGTHLWVCVEDFDPLGGDEQIDLGEGLSISVWTLQRDKGQKTKELVKLSSWTLDCSRSLRKTCRFYGYLQLPEWSVFNVKILKMHACLIQCSARGMLVRWTGCCLKVRWKRQKQKAFGSGVCLHQLSWHEDSELARKQQTA